jgi:hypothetical protein
MNAELSLNALLEAAVQNSSPLDKAAGRLSDAYRKIEVVKVN